MDKTLAHVDANVESFVERLNEWLRIPSISTDPTRKDDCRQAAQWAKAIFDGCGIKADLVETSGHPCIIADSGPADGAPTILVYGHYDVQPIGEPSLWNSPAFEPTVRDGAIFARGSADDKGQVLTHLLAAESWMKTAGKLPIRVKFLIEGEEEIGSPNLHKILVEHRKALECDYVVISDTAKLSADQPAVTYGTKGLIYKEIIVTGPRNDLHSGSFGGTVTNPGNALAGIIASLRDKDNRVTLPGYYDDVRDITGDEKAQMKKLPFDEKDYQQMTGSPSLDGEKGFTTLERRWGRPTLDVNGLFGGYAGEGAATIIPARVGAKVSMRIVPDQDPTKISDAFDKAVLDAAPPGVKVEVRSHEKCAAYVAPLDSPAMQVAAQAIEIAFGKKPVFIREGGSLPILPMFKQELGAESIMMGYSYPNCNLHGPNEFFHIDDFHKGIRADVAFMELLSKV